MMRRTGLFRRPWSTDAVAIFLTSLPIPAERWGESVFTIGDEEIVMEVSVEKDVIIALMAGDDAVWKGTLTGFKELLRGAIKPR